MAIEEEIPLENTTLKQTTRTRAVRIHTPENGDYVFSAEREVISELPGILKSTANRSYSVNRKVQDVFQDTVEIPVNEQGDTQTVSVALVAAAVSAFADKWDQEDKAAKENPPEQEPPVDPAPVPESE